MREWGGFDGLDDLIARQPDKGMLRDMLDSFKIDEMGGNGHLLFFQPLADLILPSIRRTEEFFASKTLSDMPPKVEKKISKDVEAANRSDRNASLVVPLLFWSLSDENYEVMIRNSIMYPVRVLLMNIFWGKSKDIVDFVPHYRSNWNV